MGKRIKEGLDMSRLLKSMFLPKSDDGTNLRQIQKQNYYLIEEGPLREVFEIFDKEGNFKSSSNSKGCFL
jgi:hypothetical protein